VQSPRELYKHTDTPT